MNIDWTFRGDTLPEDVRGRIDQHLGKLGRFLRDPVDAHVVVAYEGPTHQRLDLEVVLTSPEGTFRGRGEGHDLTDVAKDVLQRVETQVHRTREKLREGRRHGSVEREMVSGNGV